MRAGDTAQLPEGQVTLVAPFEDFALDSGVQAWCVDAGGGGMRVKLISPEDIVPIGGPECIGDCDRCRLDVCAELSACQACDGAGDCTTCGSNPRVTA